MKLRWLALILALTALYGCSAPVGSAEGSDAIAQPKPTGSVGFSVFPVGQALDEAGAVEAFPLDTEGAHGIEFLGGDILVFSGYGNTVLTLLSGESLEILAEITLPCPVFPEEPAVTVDEKGLTYVDKFSRELVFLDKTLTETRRLALPEDCGVPALRADRQRLFYCTGQGLRVLDLETGLDRPIREMQFPVQELVALHWDDQVLQCAALQDDGSYCTLLLSAETGALLHEAPEDMPLWTGNGLYVTTTLDGAYQQLLSGSDHFGPSVLVPEREPLGMEPVLAQSSILLWHEQDGFLSLDLYHLESGAHTASVLLPDFCVPVSPRPDRTENALWFLCTRPDTGKDLLCRWDTEQSGVSEPGSWLQPRWDSENPDTEGLAQCRELARQISEKHDVNILLWTDATAVQPWDYALVAEYQVPLLQSSLTRLDAALSLYPPAFLKEAAAGQVGPITICLVRDIRGNPDAGALESALGLHFRGPDGTAYLAITPGVDLAQHLNHELFHIIDSRVLSTCDAYDNWNDLNPPDFQYDSKNPNRADQSKTVLISGEGRCFIDLYAMGSAKEDRARIMEYAMAPHQEELFSAPAMQRKLRQLCIGIREAFSLADETYPWEQYLDAPLT